ncbi:hypothetical protein ES703_18073 [subsurface metagenome]
MPLPNRIYVCGFCGYNSQYRWSLRDHLVRRHHLTRIEATVEAWQSEFHLALNPASRAPRYVNPLDDIEEEIDEED